LPNIREIGERFMLHDDIEHRYILQENITTTSERETILKSVRWEKYVQERKIQRKMCTCTPITMVINEKTAALSLPNLNYSADLETVLLSEDEEFVRWCHNYFFTKWKVSKGFDEKLIQVLDY